MPVRRIIVNLLPGKSILFQARTLCAWLTVRKMKLIAAHSSSYTPHGNWPQTTTYRFRLSGW